MTKPQRFSRLPRWALLLSLIPLPSAWWLSETKAAPPEILDSAPIVDEYGSGGWRSFFLALDPDTYVRMQASPRLLDPDWQSLGEPLFSSGNRMEWHVRENTLHPFRFFRATTRPFPATIRRLGDQYLFTVHEPIQVGDALEFLSRRIDSDLFPLGADDRNGWIAPGEYLGETMEAVAAHFGVLAWDAASRPQDPTPEERVLGDPRLQLNPLPDDEPGIGQMDGGWSGDGSGGHPEEASADPPLDPNSDMPFMEKVEPLPPETVQEPATNGREPGVHLRLAVRISREGRAEILRAQELEGDARLERPFPVPGVGSVVWVVRSPLGAPDVPGKILFIGVGPEPFIQRAYFPAFRGLHGETETDEGVLYLAVPAPEIEGRAALEGLSVEILRVVGEPVLDFLTPEGYLQHTGSFSRLALIGADDLIAVLTQAPALGDGDTVPSPHVNSRTLLHRSGPASRKFNFVIVGDGFSDSPEDQAVFNHYVQTRVIEQFSRSDIHSEILNGMNIIRLNTISPTSGVTQVNSSGTVTLARSTLLGYRYSGLWEKCWIEETPASPGEPGTVNRLQTLLAELAPEADLVAVVLHEDGQGGCARGSRFATALQSGSATFAHEFGHSPGGLGDEYQCNEGGDDCGIYEHSAIPPWPNVDNRTLRADVKWREWIPSWRPIPTAASHVANHSQDIGVFAGATWSTTKYWDGIYRPSWRGRMNDNGPPHNPVGHTTLRDLFLPWQQADFRNSVSLDIDGDGLGDLVMIDDRQMSVHLARERNRGADDPVRGRPPRSAGGTLWPVRYDTGTLRGRNGAFWIVRQNDILLPGDFDGDGREDLFVVNFVDWAVPYACLIKFRNSIPDPVRFYRGSLPGWQMAPNDQFKVGDFDGDGLSDLMVYNGKDWNRPTLALLRSTGTEFEYLRRYDGSLPGWSMGRNETFHIGDFDGDGRDDVLACDAESWNQVHLRVYASVEGGLALRDRHYGVIASSSTGSFWHMRRQNQFIPLDYDGNGTTDLAIFNGRDWAPAYLGMFRVTNGTLLMAKRYNNQNEGVPGWHLRRRDRFWVADVNADGRQDLVVFNGINWPSRYLGMMVSIDNGNLQATWQQDRIGHWFFLPGDDFHVADIRGGGGLEDLIVFRKNQLGLLRSLGNRYKLEAYYPRWIHNHRFTANGQW